MLGIPIAAVRRLKVAFIVEKFPNISETFILDEIVGAIRRGLEVDIYALRRGTAGDVHPAYTAYGLHDRTYYCVPAVPNRLARLLAAGPATFKVLLRKPAAFIRCAFTRKRGIQSRTFVSLARAFVNSGKRYDVVHAHFGPNGIRAEALRRAGVFAAPLITTFHGYDATSFVADNGTAVYDDLAARGDRFIAVSQSIADALAAIGIPLARTEIRPLGVNCTSNTPGRIDEAPAGVRVLSIGRFVEKKGFEFGIAAVARAHEQCSQLSYHIIGDGDLRSPLTETVAKLNAEQYVTFHGYKNQADVAKMLTQADIMLVPSVTAANGDQEGLPMVVKEAMAKGVPVIASRHAGIPEIVVDGVTGLLADERDAATLAEHLVRLAVDVDWRRRLGDAGRSMIESQFNNERLIDDLVALYRLLAQPRPPARKTVGTSVGA